MKAKLDETGTLTGDAERTLAGSDSEVLLRSRFRGLAMPQWKDLVQRISYGSGFGGEVSDVSASSPEASASHFGFPTNTHGKTTPTGETAVSATSADDVSA